MVDYLLRCAIAPDQPRPSIETLLHAFVPAAARRPHASRRDHRADLDARRPPARGGGVRRRGRLARLPAARLRHVAPHRRAARGATRSRAAVLLEKHGLVTWGETRRGELRRDDRVRLARRRSAIDAAGRGRFGLGGRTVAELGEEARDALLAQSLPALRGALLADTDGVVLEVDRSPEAVAFASSARAPEVSQVGAPCPDHLINTKHKPLVVDFDPERDGADELAAALPRRRRGVRALVPRLLRAQPRRRDAAVPDRSRRAARRARPGRRHRHDRRATRAARASRATSTTARSPSRTPRTRSAGSAR